MLTLWHNSNTMRIKLGLISHTWHCMQTLNPCKMPSLAINKGWLWQCIHNLLSESNSFPCQLLQISSKFSHKLPYLYIQHDDLNTLLHNVCTAHRNWQKSLLRNYEKLQLPSPKFKNRVRRFLHPAKAAVWVQVVQDNIHSQTWFHRWSVQEYSIWYNHETIQAWIWDNWLLYQYFYNLQGHGKTCCKATIIWETNSHASFNVKTSCLLCTGLFPKCFKWWSVYQSASWSLAQSDL